MAYEITAIIFPAALCLLSLVFYPLGWKIYYKSGSFAGFAFNFNPAVMCVDNALALVKANTEASLLG